MLFMLIFLMGIAAPADMFFLGAALYVLYCVLGIIGVWKVFGKMDEPGWKSIIPFYNTYTLYKRVWS